AGRVAGLLLPPPDADGRALPADVAFAAKAGTLADVLRSAGVEVILEDRSVAIAPEDLTTRATGMTVLVSCWE
ncbi:MAG: peptidoglycan-binding protein, partial [Jannaschia sp.]